MAHATGHRGHQDVACVEHPFEDCEGALPGSPPPGYAPVPEPVPDAEGVASGGPLHGGVVAPGLDSEVALVAVGDLPGPGEVDAAVVDRGRRHLQVSDETPVGVGLGVELVAEDGSLPPLRPCAIPAPAGPGVLPAGLSGWSGVCGDEGGVLDDPLPDPQPLPVHLALELLPQLPVLPCGREHLPEVPDGGVVGRGVEEAEEPLEAEAVGDLPLQLGVGEAVPVLEDEELHHQNLVQVGEAALGAVVPVEAGDYGAEGLPVDEAVDPGEPVAELLNLLVGYPEHVGSEGVHGVMVGLGIYKLCRRGIT